MSYQSYLTYKESKIPWIGNFPSHWELKSVKELLCERIEKNDPIKTDFILSLTMNQGVIPYSEREGGGNKAKEDLTAYKLAYPDDIVMNSMNIVAGSVGLSKYFGAVSPVYYMLYPRDKKNSVKYFSKIFESESFQKSLLGLGNGIMMKESASSNKLNTIRMRIPMAKLNAQFLPYPPPEEQLSIDAFLTNELTKIDTLVDEQEKLIELLKEKRQAVISHTVTKGLDLKVKMKPSGVRLLGEVPQHWEVKPIQWIASINDEVLPESTDADYEIEYVDIGSVNLSSGIERSEIHKFKDAPSRARRVVKNGDVIVSTVRTYLKAIAFVKEPPANMIVSTGFAVIRSKSGLKSNFAKFGLQSTNFIDEVISRSTGISYPAINASELAKIKIPLPPIEGQIAICAYLDKQTLEIYSLISESKKIILLLQERRSALISAAVTGQIDVRNYQSKEVG